MLRLLDAFESVLTFVVALLLVLTPCLPLNASTGTALPSPSAESTPVSVPSGAAAMKVAVAPLGAPANGPQIMFLNGRVTGVVNGTPIDLEVTIDLDFATGEETAVITNIPPGLGETMSQATWLVTVGGPGGGLPVLPLNTNLFHWSGGNFVNEATVDFRDSEDTLDVIHNVSFDGGDTMTFTATMNGTMPVRNPGDQVQYLDFDELLVPQGSKSGGAQAFVTGVGYQGDFTNANHRGYFVNGGGIKIRAGKGNLTRYTGDPLPGPVIRRATLISTIYDPVEDVLNIHLFNTLRLAAIFGDGFESGGISAWSSVVGNRVEDLKRRAQRADP